MTDCDKCKEYDKEKNYCPVFCNVINDTLTDRAIEELEKIKEECEDLIQFHGKRTDDYGIGKKEAYQHIIEFVNERIVKLKGE